MKTHIAIAAVVIAGVVISSRGDEALRLSSNWDYDRLISQTVTVRFIGTNDEGLFTFTRVGGTVEPWTPKYSLAVGDASSDGLFKLVRSSGGSVEVTTATKETPIRVDSDETFSITTVLICFRRTDGEARNRSFYVGIGKPFKFPDEDSEFIIEEASEASLSISSASKRTTKKTLVRKPTEKPEAEQGTGRQDLTRPPTETP